jgi:hypothetical protein
MPAHTSPVTSNFSLHTPHSLRGDGQADGPTFVSGGRRVPRLRAGDAARWGGESAGQLAAFSLIKKWGCLSQNRIASACQLTPGKVSTITSGQQQVTSFDVICRIADGLRIPGRMVGLADRPGRPDRSAPPTTHPPQQHGLNLPKPPGSRPRPCTWPQTSPGATS